MEIGLSPIWGTTAKNGAYGATANRAELPPYSPGRRAPSCVAKDGESLGPGGQAALSPYLGWSPTLPRCRDPGPAGNPVRAIRRPATHLVLLGTLERPAPPWRLTSVFAFNSAGAMYRLGPGQYASNLCSGSRALTEAHPPPVSRRRLARPGSRTIRRLRPVHQGRWPAILRRRPLGRRRLVHRGPASRLALYGQSHDWPRAAGCSGGIRTGHPQDSTPFQC